MTPLTFPSHFANMPSERGGFCLKTADLAGELGFKPATIRKWARQGKLIGRKIGDDWRFASLSVGEGDMGRRKKGYSAPKYIYRRSDSPYWWIKWKDINLSTGVENLPERLPEAQLFLVREQERYLAKQILDRDQGQSITFPQLMERYLREESPTKLSCKSDHVNVRKPLEFWPEKRIDTFSVQEIYRYQDWRKTQYVQPKKKGIEPTKLISGATINREVALVKHALRKAVRWGYLAQSPIPEGEVEGMSEKRRERYITDGEFSSIRESMDLTRSRIIGSLYFSAKRVGRILALQWKQIDLSDREITFQQSSKNKLTAEVIYINDPFLRILSEIQEERKRQALISPYVFHHKDGSPIKSIKIAWKTACKKAGVQDVRIHDIRHKAITDMAKAGVPKQVIQKAVGHSQGSTTERYTHLQTEDVKQAFEALK